jgi:hypothetical protein
LPFVFASGAALAATQLNTYMIQPGTGATGTRLVAGTTGATMTAVASVSVTVTFGYTFSAAPKFVYGIQSGSNIRLVATMQGGPSTTGVTLRVETTDGATTTISPTIHWIAIGPP